MAGRGPAPKPPGTTRRRNASPAVKTVAADEKLRGPELPDSLEWPDATRLWWLTWRKSPQAQTFTETDWSFLMDTAILHAEFWLGDHSVGAELRLRVAKFGATPEDRARLKIAVGDPKPTPGTPTAAAAKKTTARKGRLLQVVKDGETAETG